MALQSMSMCHSKLFGKNTNQRQLQERVALPRKVLMQGALGTKDYHEI